MTKKDFIAYFFVRNSKMINSDEDADKAQKKAELLWKAYQERNPSEGRVARKSLSDKDQQNIKDLIKKWNSTPGVKKDKTKPDAVSKVVRDTGFDDGLWSEVRAAADRYLKWAVESGEVKYVPGLQVWLKDKRYEVWNSSEEKVKNNEVELMRAKQELAGIRQLYNMNPKSEGLRAQVEGWEERIRELLTNKEGE